MRQISTLFACLILFLSAVYAQDAGNRKIPTLEILKRSLPSTTSDDETVIRIRCMASPLNDKPLFVIDGTVAEEFELKNINPNDIESITVLKDNIARVLYGCKAFSGAVLVTTKTANQRTIIVKDLLTGKLLTGANVDLSSTEGRMDNVHLITDSVGKVVTNKIGYGKDYELKVTSVGYKAFRFITNTKQLGKIYTVLLVRNYENLEDVTVERFSDNLRPRKNNTDNFLAAYIRYGVGGIKTLSNERLRENENPFSNIKLYPNPVLHSQKVNIDFEITEEGKVSLRLFSLDNKLIDSKEYQAVNGINRIGYVTNAQLGSGIYVIQLIDKNNHLVITEKLVVQ